VEEFKGLFAGLMFAGFVFLVVGPPVLLLLGRRALHRGRPKRTGDLATIAVVASWFLLPITLLAAVRFQTEQTAIPRPVAWLLPLYPLALWLLAWRLSRAARTQARGPRGDGLDGDSSALR
jgi:hypothetical protein